MRKVITLLVLLCFTMNSFAGVGGTLRLERLLDDYQFAMTVEWDQKDREFYDSRTQKFFQEMSGIIREEGLSKGEILTLVEKKLVSKTTIEALKLKLSLLSQSDSPEELARTLKESTKDMYHRGASWNGDITLILGIGIVVIAVLAYKWWWDVHHKCVAWEEKYDCSSSSWDDRSCWTETDANGQKYEACDYYWQQEVTTTCGPMNFCTRYEKI